ncbi:DeoR family transcriptional regulator [Helicobacter sp. L8]|uniref:DeoR family transcriptional regulator n=1 Tax=Helicobacter sp. L8 TaxID=2316078 RepID=UPI000EAB844B|nr:DeoR family transcriptional regulator [Helicobacter sp. L8]
MKDHDKLATRLSQILLKINQGEVLHVRSLAQEFGVSVRTIQRDLNRFAPLIVGGGGEVPFL